MYEEEEIHSLLLLGEAAGICMLVGWNKSVFQW